MPTEVTALHISSLMEKWTSSLSGINITLISTALTHNTWHSTPAPPAPPQKKYKARKEARKCNPMTKEEVVKSREPYLEITQIWDWRDWTET